MSEELEQDLKRTLDVIEGLFSLLDHELSDIILSDVPRIFESGKRLEEFYSSLASKHLTLHFEENMSVSFLNRGHLLKPDVSRLPRICDCLLLKFIALDKVELIKCALKTYVSVLSVERLCAAAHKATQLRLIFTYLSNDLSPDEATLLESSFILTSWMKSFKEEMIVDLNLDLKISEMLESEVSLKLLLSMLLLNDVTPIVVRIKSKIVNTVKQKIELQSKPFIFLFCNCVTEQHFSVYPNLLTILLQSLKSSSFLMSYSPESKQWSKYGEKGFSFDEMINILKGLITMKSFSKEVFSSVRLNKTADEPCIWIDIEQALNQFETT